MHFQHPVKSNLSFLNIYFSICSCSMSSGEMQFWHRVSVSALNEKTHSTGTEEAWACKLSMASWNKWGKCLSLYWKIVSNKIYDINSKLTSHHFTRSTIVMSGQFAVWQYADHSSLRDGDWEDGLVSTMFMPWPKRTLYTVWDGPESVVVFGNDCTWDCIWLYFSS